MSRRKISSCPHHSGICGFENENENEDENEDTDEDEDGDEH
jgi:hypothetical protein